MVTQNNKDTRKVIGRAETVSFPGAGIDKVPARIDTGARTSALWATYISEDNGVLRFKLFGPSSPYYTGETVELSHFEKIVVSSSIGEPQERYKVQLLVKLKGKKIKARFTLADRSEQVYPVLVGRNILRGKFVVDVKEGKPLYKEERQRSQKLQSKLAPKE